MTQEPESHNIHLDNILEEEIKTWFEFGNILKNGEGEVFFKMLQECQIYENGAQTKGSIMSTESLLMSIILNQQRVIKELLKSYDMSSRQQPLI